MKSRIFSPFVSFSLILLIVGIACGQAGGGTVEPAQAEATATNTPKPTATLRPTVTPDVAATQKAEEFSSLLQDFQDKGYVTPADGVWVELDPFSESWAQLGWYQWWTFDNVASDLVFKAHFSWSVASSTPEISGCGFIFGIQENGDHYAVFLDRSRILFLMSRGSNVYNVGKTTGSGRANFGNPAEADFILAVKDQGAAVSVDGEVTTYTLSMDQTTEGQYGPSVLSGTNKDYGTRCEMTDMIFWQPE